MTITATPMQDKHERLNQLLTVWLYRIAAVVLFFFGMEYWVRLVGVHDGPLWRFDLMPIPWKVTASALAVLYPVAGVGLWMTVSWGVVIWVIVAIVEGVMHVVFPDLFGVPTGSLLFHLVGLCLLATLRSIGWWEARKRLARAGYRAFETNR